MHNRDRLKNIGNKSLDLSQASLGIRPTDSRLESATLSKRSKINSQYHSRTNMNMDSLQLFQEELQQALWSAVAKKPKKKMNDSTIERQAAQIKTEVNQIRNIIESQKEIKSMEEKLEKLVVSLQEQKARQMEKTLTPSTPAAVPTSPYIIPQMIYPPPYMYPQEYPRQRMRRPKTYSSYDDQQLFEEEQNYKTRSKAKKSPKSDLRTKLRYILFAVAFTVFVKKQAKKLSTVRKSNLKSFWLEKFGSQVNNIKNWLLDTQKYSLSIILEKKNLSLDFFDQKSQKIKQQKQKFVMQVVGIGLNKMLEDCTTQKISLFAQILCLFCRRGSFAINRFWTAYEIEQICISEYFGFFRIDASLEKYLIGLMIFIKIFVFNMFLQPSKFDAANFPKKQQPLTQNMKLISSVFYHLAKEVINQYRDESRNIQVYRLGNWLDVPKQFIVECSQPLVYGNAYPEEHEYISGLFTRDSLEDLTSKQSWSVCTRKIKAIVEKLYTETVNKSRLVKKNLKYKLYN